MTRKPLSAEDRLDRVYRMVALVLLGTGLIKGVAALRIALHDDSLVNHIAGLVYSGLLIVTPLLCVLAVWRSVRFKLSCAGCSLLARQGFVFHAIQDSAMRAALLTFPALALMNELADHNSLPVAFYLDIALAILTLTFSVSYLVSSYVSAEEE